MKAKVTAISGSGVGMDVVRKDIESLKGQIESEVKKGSTFKNSIAVTIMGGHKQMPTWKEILS